MKIECGSFNNGQMSLVESPASLSPFLGGEKKVLICYFTKSGLTRRVVEVLARQIGETARICEIQSDVNYQGVAGLVRSIYHSKTGRAQDQKITSPIPEPAEFDAFVIAGPVWNYHAPAPIMSFLSNLDFGGKPVVVLPTCTKVLTGFAEDIQSVLKNAQCITKDGFYDVGNQTAGVLTGNVQKWLE
jgi:flavodoxin